MDEQSTDPGTKQTIRWFLLPPTLVVMYVLSIGPAFRVLPDNPFSTTYGPLITFAEHCRPFDHFLTWYMVDVWKSGPW